MREAPPDLPKPSSTDQTSWVVTTHIGATPEHQQTVEAFARSKGLPYAVREERTLAKIARAHDGAAIGAWHAEQGWRVRSLDGKVWKWHPGIAHIRVAATHDGRPDRLIRALAPVEGLRVLDANLGMGRDALVIAANGAREVVGLEIDPIICALTREGLTILQSEGGPLASYPSTIRCVHTCQREYLRRCASDAFDVVYFSPMFITPSFQSSDMKGLRQVAAGSWPDAETLSEALRVAPKMVMKLEFGRHPPLPPPRHIYRKKNSRLVFAVYDRGTPASTDE